MDIFFILTSVNKIALIALLITFFFIIFEIFQIVSQRKKNYKPIIPDFNAQKKYKRVIAAKPIVQKAEKKNNFVKPNNRILLILATLIFTLLALYIVNLLFSQKSELIKNRKEIQQLAITPGAGIRIYNENWSEITPPDFKGVVKGEQIFIGVETIPGVITDKARIKVNQSNWQKNDETTLFKASDRIFYKQYIIASDESALHVDAQLHNAKKGWLE